MGLYLQLLLIFLILSCQESQTDITEKQATVADEVLEHDGTQASLTAGFTKPQKLKVSETTGLGDSEAIFRPGSLSVSSEISMEEGVDIVDSNTTDELGLQEDYIPFSKPLNISSSSDIDGTVPLSIALEMSSDLRLSSGSGKIFIAIYVLETPSGPKIGIVPTAEIIVNDALASFDFTTEGTYTKASFQLAAFEFSGALTKEQTTDRNVEPRSSQPIKEQDLEEEKSEEDEQTMDSDVNDHDDKESEICPEIIDESKILAGTELCGVKGALDLQDLKAENIRAGKTIAGINGTFQNTYTDCTEAAQEGCIATSTFRTMDLSAKDASGAVDISNTLFSARVKSSSIFEYWDENGNRHTNRGDEDLTESNIADDTEIFGITGNSGSSLDCSSIPFGTWILVPGDPDYGTNDFCVMKYEAKNNSNVPESLAAGTPWVFIDQQDSKTECASLGKGYHLITNDEWMTIATNVAAQGANWDGGVVGTNEMTRGHSDNSPSSACAADTSDSNFNVEADCSGSSSGDEFNQRRTHILSNGELIWDLSGNVSEWTSYFNDEEKPTPNTNAWSEFTDVTATSTMPLTDLIPQVAIDSSWDSNESIGKYYPGNDGSGGGLTRGGNFNSATMAGVYSANIYFSPTHSYSHTGFRCAVSLP